MGYAQRSGCYESVASAWMRGARWLGGWDVESVGKDGSMVR